MHVPVRQISKCHKQEHKENSVSDEAESASAAPNPMNPPE